MKQLTINFRRIETPFEKFDRENPQIWSEFEKTALNLIDKGVKHYGSKAIFEIIRYHRRIDTNDPDFKLNNNWTACYARKFEKVHPEHKGFFEKRKVKSGD